MSHTQDNGGSRTIFDQTMDDLAAAIRTANARGENLFDCPSHRIIIPSRINRTFIDLALARRGLAVTGVGYDTLDWSVLRLAKALDAENIEDNLTRRDVFAHLLMLLRPDRIDRLFEGVDGAGEAKQLLKAYMTGDEQGSARYSLAHVLSGIFVRYAEEAPGLLSQWQESSFHSDNPIEVIEACLYRQLLELGTLPAALTFGKELPAEVAGSEDPVPDTHILGYGYIPSTVLGQLNALGQKASITLYHEALPELHEDTSRPDDDCALLQGWNKVIAGEKANTEEYMSGAKHLHIVSVSDGRFGDESDPKQVISRSFGVTDGDIRGKVRVIPCPGPEREAEAVWTCVCNDLKAKDKDGHHLYSPEDICVLVCDPNKYYPHMERVFGRKEKTEVKPDENTCEKTDEKTKAKTLSVPFNLTCVRPGPGSSYLEGVKALFDLMGSRMERFRIEKLFTNPCFLNRQGLEYGDVTDWLGRMEANGVWEFFDAAHKGDDGDLLHTWKHSGRRYRLAKATRESRDGLTPPEDILHTGRDAALLSLAEPLWQELCALAALDREDRSAMRDENKIREAIDRVFEGVLTLLEHWLAPDKKEAGMARYVADRLNKFRTQCIQRNYVPYLRDLRYFLEITAEPMQFEHGQPFIGGVMTGHIKNITFPDFRILYLMGFNEDNFPGTEVPSSLDLTGGKREIVTQTDLNRFAFLRAVLWAADKVYITYDCKDRVKNAERFPSSCVTDLEKLLGISEEQPLSLFARTDLVKYGKDAPEREWTVPYHGEDLEEARALSGVVAKKPGVNTDTYSSAINDTAGLTTGLIREFLLDPGDFYLRRLLGLGDFDRDPDHSDFIPPATPSKAKWQYQRPAYLAYATAGGDKDEAAGSYDSEFRQQGKAPEGPLADIEKALLREDKAFEQIAKYGGSAQKAPLKPELFSEQTGKTYTVTGETHVFESEDMIRVFIPKKIEELRNRIEAYVAGAVYLLSRDDSLPFLPVHICGADKEYALCETCEQTDQIKRWLTGVCDAVTELDSFYSAPAEIIIVKEVKAKTDELPEHLRNKYYGIFPTLEKPDEDKELDRKVNELTALFEEKCRADLNKDKNPDHYWHYLLKEHPDRLVIPGAEELKAAAERLRPISELKEYKSK